MVTFIFKFGPRKGQLQVKLRKIRSNFKIQNFLRKVCLSCAVLSHNSKNVIYFYVRQLEIPKIAFQICDVITFRYLGLRPLHSQKQRYCLSILFACCSYVLRSHIFQFFGYLENFGFYRQLFLKNQNVEFWWVRID